MENSLDVMWSSDSNSIISIFLNPHVFIVYENLIICIWQILLTN